ncbi:MAG UNVERIFIED_CONTAM: hypothetical protein LVR18_03190 [Planctomycetaceae bacterium]|jgi:hypothetical protein
MNLEEFTIRLNELDTHLVAVLRMFEEDTGVKIGTAVVEINQDGVYEVFTGLNFPEPQEAE